MADKDNNDTPITLTPYNLLNRPIGLTAHEVKDQWAIFELSDGTVVRGKIVLIKARRMPGQFNDAGDPQYQFNAQVIFDVVSVPEGLERPEPKPHPFPRPPEEQH